MYAGFALVLALTIVSSFMVGREWDHMKKIAAHNRELRRQELQRKKMTAQIRREIEESDRKIRYMANVAQNAPGVK